MAVTEDLSESSFFLRFASFWAKEYLDDLLIDVQRSLDGDEFFFFLKKTMNWPGG